MEMDWVYTYNPEALMGQEKGNEIGWLVGRLTPPFSTKIGDNRVQGQDLGWRFSSARLRMADDTTISRLCCLFLFSDNPKWERIGEAHLS